MSLTQKDLAERVLIFGEKRGILRYIGPTHFESGEWCGVELDLPEGKNNGQISGTDYFHCLPNHGLFVPSHCVELLKDIQPKRFEFSRKLFFISKISMYLFFLPAICTLNLFYKYL